MRRKSHQDYRPTRFDLVEWLVVTLILAIAFFAILQVVGDDLGAIALSAWESGPKPAALRASAFDAADGWAILAATGCGAVW